MPKGGRGGKRGGSGKQLSSNEIKAKMNAVGKKVADTEFKLQRTTNEKEFNRLSSKKNSLLKKQRKLKDEYNKAQDREVKAYNASHPEPHHTFVNGFGEATHRYITNPTYERAMKRNDKEIQNRMKGYGKRL